MTYFIHCMKYMKYVRKCKPTSFKRTCTQLFLDIDSIFCSNEWLFAAVDIVGYIFSYSFFSLHVQTYFFYSYFPTIDAQYIGLPSQTLDAEQFLFILL